MSRSYFKPGEANVNYKGFKTRDKDGGLYIYKPNHPRSQQNGYVKEAYLIAEEILGKPLPKGAIVHHADGNPKNNAKNNLVICQNRAYHNLLHARMKALNTTGDVHKRTCYLCKKYDNVENMYKRNSSFRHKECHAKLEKERHNKRISKC